MERYQTKKYKELHAKHSHKIYVETYLSLYILHSHMCQIVCTHRKSPRHAVYLTKYISIREKQNVTDTKKTDHNTATIASTNLTTQTHKKRAEKTMIVQ